MKENNCSKMIANNTATYDRRCRVSIDCMGKSTHDMNINLLVLKRKLKSFSYTYVSEKKKT